MNPVLKKELKTRMRTWKTSIMLSIYILILSSLMLLIFIETGSFRGFRPGFLNEMYLVIAVLQLILITFIVPATTASSISGERERSTFDLLLCTRLSSISIVLGKLMASLAQIVLLLVVSIPILSILFLFGGISPGNILVLFIFYFITSILFGSIGIFASAFFNKTSTSTVISYLITLFLIGGTFIVVIFSRGIFLGTMGRIPTRFLEIVLYANPFSGLSAILGHQLGEDILGGLLNRRNSASVLIPLYYNIGFDLIISSILLYLTSLKINPMKSFSGLNKKGKKKKSAGK